MPYRSRELLQQWVREFTTTSDDSLSTIDVLRHDGGAGTDTGLVVIGMTDLPSDMYLHPAGPGNPKWDVNFGPRERDLTLSAAKLRNLTAELSRAAALCEFLETKSTHHTTGSDVRPQRLTVPF